MKKACLIIALAASVAMNASVVSYPSETVRYKVAYRWGFINKIAGSGIVVTSCSPQGEFHGRLEGHSIPWGGRIYSVRDSLAARMSGVTEAGVPNETVIYKNGLYFKPYASARQSLDLSDPSAFWDTDGRGTLDASADTKEAISITADMLSLFYYAKAIDFSNMTDGSRIVIPITGPDGSEGSLAIAYGGEQSVTVRDVDVPAYAIVFNYTYHGTPSAYPVHCWISREGRIPVLISADLVIGHLEMIAEL